MSIKDVDRKKKEAEEIMAREDLPEDFPSVEESEADVLGHAYRTAYTAPKPVEEEIPQPIITADPNISGIYVTKYRPFEVQANQGNARIERNKEATITLDTVYDETLKSLSEALKEGTQDQIITLTNLLSVLVMAKGQEEAKNLVNPRATLPGETPLRK